MNICDLENELVSLGELPTVSMAQWYRDVEETMDDATDVFIGAETIGNSTYCGTYGWLEDNVFDNDVKVDMRLVVKNPTSILFQANRPICNWYSSQPE
jgi:hypothetical protein